MAQTIYEELEALVGRYGTESAQSITPILGLFNIIGFVFKPQATTDDYSSKDRCASMITMHCGLWLMFRPPLKFDLD